MYSKNEIINKKKISHGSIAAFLVTLTICWTLVGLTVLNRSDVEKLTMEQLIMEKSAKISDVISKLAYKTQALAALVIQHNGKSLAKWI